MSGMIRYNLNFSLYFYEKFIIMLHYSKQKNQIMKTKYFVLFLMLFTACIGYSAPVEDFHTVYTRAESNPKFRIQAEQLAVYMGLPVRIYTHDYKFIEAKGSENGQVVYTVILNIYNIWSGAYTAFYNEIESAFDLSKARIDYGNGHVVDYSGGKFDPVTSKRGFTGLWLLIPEWTADKVYAFDALTGDLIDPDFIPTTNPTLQSPRHALQAPWGTIMVADQISDAVQEFDTGGVFIRTYAPAGGPNPSILDNIRGVYFRQDRKLLVTVGSGANQNTVQLFDTGGVSLGPFISTGLNSPFYIVKRDADYLIANSSAPNDVTRYDLSGAFISNFIVSSNLAFPQQILRLPNGNFVIAGFSSPSGLVFFDSTGNYLSTFNAVTGNRGVYRLGNGNYLTTNGTGVHEIDDTTGALIRTVAFASNFQFIDVYNPSGVTSLNNEGTIKPSEFKLYNNYPNPFNPVTNIRFAVPKTAFVSVKVYDALGREISSLVNEVKKVGEYNLSYNASDLPSGIYFYTLKSESFSSTKKMILIK